MITTILVDRANFAQDIKEVQQHWLRDLLFYIGIDADEIKDEPKDVVVEYLVNNEVEIIEYMGVGALEVKFRGEVIGEWAGADLTLKEDKDGLLYFKADIEHWSIIDEEIAE